jgi:RNA polymerase sigma-70 factor (ECF subfamily)
MRPEPATNGDAATRFEPHRAALTRHAYRMLGERAEAEDVVQDAYVRWHAAIATSSVGDDLAFLRTTVTRLCIDRARSARARRETYVGPWLPEPLVAPEHGDPEAIVTLADDVSFALLLALERLSPLERAAFLLHDVLDVPFAEIATMLERSEDAVKKLASRARTHVREPRTRAAAPAAQTVRLRAQFLAAIARDDLAALQRLLADDVVFVADSGGKVPAAMVPVEGSDCVGRLMLGIARKAAPGVRAMPAFVNASPGLVIFDAGHVIQTIAFDVREGRIVAIYVTRNPEKLQAIDITSARS